MKRPGMAQLTTRYPMAPDIQKLFQQYAAWLNGEGFKPSFENMDLSGLDMSRSALFGGFFKGANLSGCNLAGTSFRCANLSDTSFRCANLSDANLSGANIGSTDFTGAYLVGANLTGVVASSSTSGYWPIFPTEGEFIAWKAIRGYIVKLLVPTDAERSSATTRKGRVSKTLVLDIQPINKHVVPCASVTNHTCGNVTVYEVGKEVLPDSWDPDRWNECSHGIHCFLTREEAVAWAY